ncbi:retrovirus-related pol polyprotein from transposon TNT 1-94 [Tanacetum coccineum]
MTEFPQLDSCLVVLMFTIGDDLISCLNKEMAFIRVTVQQFQGRKGQSYAGTGNKVNATSSMGNNAGGQAREKLLLAQAQESGHVLDEEQLAFLIDPGILDGQAAQTSIPNNAAFQTEDLDANDFDCDDVFTAHAILMASLSNYGLNIISEVPHSEPYHNDMDNQSVHAMHDFEQPHIVDFLENKITSDSNIIPYSQYLQETQQAAVQDTNLYAQQDSMILSVIAQMLEQMINLKAQRIKPTLYDGSVISSQHVVILVIDEEETLILEERFFKHFIPQQELSVEQAFWFQISNPNTEQSDISLVRIEAPSELPKSSTSTSKSKPSGNTKNNRILRTTNSNMKNKVEDHYRSAKSKSNKMNRVVEPIGSADVKNSMLNANSKLICATCNKCMFDAIHDMCVPLSSTKVVPLKETTSHLVETQNPEIKVYSRRLKQVKSIGSSKKSKIVKSRVANNSKPNHSWGSNATDVPSSSSLVNDKLSRLFSDLEVAFQKNTCFIQDLDDVDILSGSRDTNLYTISLDDILKTSLICLLSKASKTKSWLWHRRLSHLNFGTLNHLAKDDFVRDIPKLKFKKYHLCSTCELGKSKKSSDQPKAEDTNQEKLYLLHMDLCGLMHVESINGKKYILVIVDDYSRFTWVKFSRSKDEAPDAIIKCIKNIHVCLNATVRNLMHDKKPDLSFLHVFCSLCYPTNDSEDLGKLNAKADIGIIVGYAPAKKAFSIYNRRTRKIIETIHVTFDELTAMAFEQFNLGLGLQFMTPGTSSSGLVPNPVPQQPIIPPTRND